MRADRLLTILMLLQTRGRMTAFELANQLEVSERTIYRDMEALGIAGIPVCTERGPGGGCSLLDGYQTRLTGLTETEIRALSMLTLLTSLDLLSDLGLRKTLDDALLKLQAALPASTRASAEQAQQKFYVDATAWPETCLSEPVRSIHSYLQTIQQAVWQEHKLCLVYREQDEMWREMLVEPYGLVTKAGAWFLVAASCVASPICRVFHVARIYAAEPTAEAFVRPENFDLANYWSAYCLHEMQTQALRKIVPAHRFANNMQASSNAVPVSQKVLPFRRYIIKRGSRFNKTREKNPIKKTPMPVACPLLTCATKKRN